MLKMINCRLMFAAISLGIVVNAAAGNDETWEKHIELGQKAREAQQLGEAEKQFKAAVQEAQNAGGKGLPLAESLSGLAAVYRDENKYAKSEALYKQSLGIKERVLGPWHLGVAETLDNIAGLMSSQGKYGKAQPLYKRAHQIREQAMVEHPDVYVDGVPVPVAHPK